MAKTKEGGKYKDLFTRYAEEFEEEVRLSLKATDTHRVVLGISGGADSTALLLALKACDAEILALHCNFGLRGEESRRDEDFVRKLCKRLDVELKVVSFNTMKYVEAHKVSTEVACRDLRYKEFRLRRDEFGADRIAVAHNADDQAETLLLNLMRGAGTAGLRGMLPDTGEILRPLLSKTRKDILRYLNAKRQNYVKDSSNDNIEYSRNFIRNKVIPLLEKRWPEAKASINRSAMNLYQDEWILNWAEDYFIEDSGTLTFEALDRCPSPFWFIRKFAYNLGANIAQCNEMYNAFASGKIEPGKHWIVPEGRIVAERDRFEFLPDQDRPMKYDVICRECSFNAQMIELIEKAPLDVLWTTLPYERLLFRAPKEGDRIYPLGMTGSTPLSKIMKDAKLTQAQKRRVIVVCDVKTGDIIWVKGLKRSRFHLVGRKGTKIFQYEVNEKIETKE